MRCEHPIAFVKVRKTKISESKYERLCYICLTLYFIYILLLIINYYLPLQGYFVTHIYIFIFVYKSQTRYNTITVTAAKVYYRVVLYIIIIVVPRACGVKTYITAGARLTTLQWAIRSDSRGPCGSRLVEHNAINRILQIHI